MADKMSSIPPGVVSSAESPGANLRLRQSFHAKSDTPSLHEHPSAYDAAHDAPANPPMTRLATVTEIVAAILTSALQHDKPLTQQLHTFAQVCRAWLLIVLTTAQLWSVLSSDQNERQIQWAARLVGNHQPLTIVYRGYSEQPDTGVPRKPGHEQFWDVTRRNNHRWRRLSLELGQDQTTAAAEIEKAFKVLESCHAPTLEDASITCFGPDMARPVKLNLLQGHAPRLRYLKLTHIAVKTWG